MPIPSPGARASANASACSESPWDEIERNYFNSMRAYRDEQVSKLAEELRIRTEDTRRFLVGNYNAQVELLRQLDVLKGQYDVRSADLRAVEAEYEQRLQDMREEWERQDVERREWFGKYRRGGEAYRSLGVGEEQRVKEGLEGRGDKRNGKEQAVGKQDTQGGRGGEGLVNGQHQEEEEEGAEPPGTEDSEMPDVQEKASREVVDGTTQMEESLTMGNGMRHDDALTDGHGNEGPEQEQPEIRQAQRQQIHQDQPTRMEKETMVDKALLRVSEQKSPAAGEEMRDAAELANEGNEPMVSAPEHDSDMVDVVPSDDGDGMDGVEVLGGPELPADLEVSMVDAAPSPDQKASIPTPPSGRDVNDEGSIPPSASAEEFSDKESAAVPTTAQQTNGTAAAQEHIPTPAAEPPRDAPTDEFKPAKKDTEMPDIRPSTEEDNDAVISAAAVQTTLTSPLSPSSSSELSSRNTTPALDTPISLLHDAGRPALSPDEPVPGSVEVVTESGALIGWLQPLDAPNVLVDRIKERPFKRPVQIRPGGQLTAEDIKCIPRPKNSEARGFKFLSFYIQATGEVHARACIECARKHGPYQDCIVVDDPDFPRCGNCEWLKRRCQRISPHQPPAPGHDMSATPQSAIKSPKRVPTSTGGFTPVNGSRSQTVEPQDESTAPGGGRDENLGGPSTGAVKKGPRTSLPTTRKALPPSTPMTGSFQSDGGMLPEINKEVLCLRDNGVVYTDPPIMRGVPLAKISQDDDYWDQEHWLPIEEIITPQLQKHQQKYEQLEQAKSTSRDKHLANRDAKRGRTILRFLKEGEFHPYQLVAKEWITPRLTHYDTLFRLAQLLLEELPKMNLDIKPSEWLRHRIHEVYLEKGDKFNLPNWLEKAYHDVKVEQLRERNGFSRVGRPPAHASKSTDPADGSNRKATAPRTLKRKDPHATPEATPCKPRPAGSPAKAAPTATVAAAVASATPQQRPKKIKIITSRASPAGDSTPATASTSKKPRIVLHSPLPRSAGEHKGDDTLDYDGYTSTDSLSGDALTHEDWHLHQVKTRTIASNVRVTQYWHWVDKDKVFEHQVLRSVKPVKWSVFKDPYDFHLNPVDIHEVMYAPGNLKVVVAHKKGKEGKDLKDRGDVMAQFKRERTKRRFLVAIREKGVTVKQISSDDMEAMWSSLTPPTLPASGDTD
ncbi:hypothetical protein VTI74DRAFT_3008 [Chaetomium olivicolor]